MVEFTASTTNSLNELAFKRLVFLSSTQTLRTHIPAGTDIIVINRKGTVRKSNNTSDGGTEEGYLDSRLVMDLTKGRTDGFVTTVNGATRAFRSTYTVVNHPTTNTQRFIQSGNVAGDYLDKNATLSNATNDIGIEDPSVYVDGDTLHFQRRNNYRSDFDDVVVLEFFTRTGFGMSVEFIETQSRFIAKGEGTTSGTSRVLDIPAGTNYIFVRQAGNANNSSDLHNENAVSSYAVIDLQTETANGFYWQQVGFTPPGPTRRDDNYVFIGLPLNGTSSRNATYSSGVYYTNATTYDLSFTLNAAKTKLTVTNKFGLVANQYQLITVADFFGARPDFAFSDSVNTDYEFYNNGNCDEMRLRITVCNPGSGDSPADLPVSFYDKNPTTDGTARLLHVATFTTPIA